MQNRHWEDLNSGLSGA
eukprot:Gb_37846 [translate_table: standard]